MPTTPDRKPDTTRCPPKPVRKTAYAERVHDSLQTTTVVILTDEDLENAMANHTSLDILKALSAQTS